MLRGTTERNNPHRCLVKPENFRLEIEQTARNLMLVESFVPVSRYLDVPLPKTQIVRLDVLDGQVQSTHM